MFQTGELLYMFTPDLSIWFRVHRSPDCCPISSVIKPLKLEFYSEYFTIYIIVSNMVHIELEIMHKWMNSVQFSPQGWQYDDLKL